MTKLYKKNELWFALVWIGVYVVGSSLADEASRALGVEKSVTLAAHALMSAALLVWVLRNHLAGKYGLCRPNAPASRFLFYLPLAVVASTSLWSGAQMNLSFAETLCFVLSMLCVGLLEELIFRGLLFRALERESLPQAVVISSLTFGLGHIVNAVNGSGQSLPETLFQIVFAILVGFALVMLFLRAGSLIPCVIFHSVNNALSAFEGSSTLSPLATVLINAALLLMLAGYAFYLYRLKGESAGR